MMVREDKSKKKKRLLTGEEVEFLAEGREGERVKSEIINRDCVYAGKIRRNKKNAVE